MCSLVCATDEWRAIQDFRIGLESRERERYTTGAGQSKLKLGPKRVSRADGIFDRESTEGISLLSSTAAAAAASGGFFLRGFFVAQSSFPSDIMGGCFGTESEIISSAASFQSFIHCSLKMMRLQVRGPVHWPFTHMGFVRQRCPSVYMMFTDPS